MKQAFRYFGESFGELYADLGRMILANIFWFLLILPALVLIELLASFINRPGEDMAVKLVPIIILGLPALLALMALAGPGTAALYSVTHTFVRGDLFEPTAFWRAFRHYFWSGWRLAATNLAVCALILLNAWFYRAIGIAGGTVLSLVFTTLLFGWLLFQPYLFPFLVEFNQPVRRVWRNAAFMVLDNLGLTLGLFLARSFLLVVATAFVLPVPTILGVLLAQVDSRAVVGAVQRYREAGRVF